MAGTITFGIKCQKGIYSLPSIKVVFTLLNYAGIPIIPLTQITKTSDINGKAKVTFNGISKGDYRIKAEIPIDSGYGVKFVISDKITIRENIPNNNCYRWDIYKYNGELLKTGTSQPDAQNPLVTIIDYTNIAPGQYKIKMWDCNKLCDSGLKSFTIIDNSVSSGLDAEGWKELQLV